ncbi:MAG: hypothetical protein HC915_11835 [Anaerolineae bacterium]|nr:hypothetical protein [Anaerolineae bacterium]
MPTTIDRPPRIQPPLPEEEIEVPAPPNALDSGQSIIELLLPLTMVVGYVALAFSGQGRSIIMIVPMGAAMLGSVFFALQRANQSRREQEAQDEAYAATLVDLRHEMLGHHQQQRDHYYHNYPDPRSTRRLVQRVNLPNVLRARTRVWERRTGGPRLLACCALGRWAPAPPP